MGLKIRELDAEGCVRRHEQVAALEDGVRYPLGEDSFEIDHGSDYFAFFRRLGVVCPYVVIDEDAVVGLAIGILRELAPSEGVEARKAWYICDLKIRSAYRGGRIPWRMFLQSLPRKYPLCPRGYGITMNPSGGRENPVVRLVKRFSLIPISIGCELWLYSLDADEMRSCASLLSQHRGELSYLSLRGVKDIVLESTGAPMPLLHVQFGPSGRDGRTEPAEDCVHMFCSPSDDALCRDLEAAGFSPSATATLLHHRMGSWDWRSVLTSEI